MQEAIQRTNCHVHCTDPITPRLGNDVNCNLKSERLTSPRQHESGRAVLSPQPTRTLRTCLVRWCRSQKSPPCALFRLYNMLCRWWLHSRPYWGAFSVPTDLLAAGSYCLGPPRSAHRLSFPASTIDLKLSHGSLKLMLMFTYCSQVRRSIIVGTSTERCRKAGRGTRTLAGEQSVPATRQLRQRRLAER